MKWIGQHIVDFIARFRSDVYLEDISTGTIASGGNLGLDSNNKIVKADEDGDTTYSIQDGELSQNNFTNDDHTKLNGIEASADVTDATNVTAAGALMDSEISNLAFVKGLTGGIANTNVLKANANIVDNDFLRVDGTSIEGRSSSEVLSDIQAQPSIGDGDLTIAFTDELQDTLDLKAPIAGPTFTGTVAIPNIANVETAITANTAKVTNSDQSQADINALDITEVGALASGTIASGFGNIDNGASTLDTGVATAASLVCTAGATFGGGYGSTGATISTAGVGQFNGALTTDAAFTCAGLALVNGGASAGGRMLVREGTDNGTNYIGFIAPAALTANTGFILPDGDGSANQVLKTDGSATLAWTDMSGGTVGWHGSGTRIKILHSDFIPDDGGRPAMIDDTGVGSEELFLESYSSNKLYATVAIPTGYTATHVMIYGSATDAVEVWEHQINSKTGVSKGTGNVDTEINITDVASSTTNYLFIQVANASGNEVHGGYITIAES